MQESDNSLNKENNNCVEMFFIHLKIFIFFWILSGVFEHNPVSWFAFGQIWVSFPSSQHPTSNSTHGALTSPLRSDSHWMACVPPTPSSFPKGSLASFTSLVAWPLPLLFQVPGMSACTPFISLKVSSSFTFRGFFPDELLQTESCTCSRQSGAADAPRTMWFLFEQLTSFHGYTLLFCLSFGSINSQ